MKKTLIIATASTLSLAISSVLYAGDIEKAQRYSAPLAASDYQPTLIQTGKVEAMETQELGSSQAEVQELGGMAWSGDNAEIQELGIACEEDDRC